MRDHSGFQLFWSAGLDSPEVAIARLPKSDRDKRQATSGVVRGVKVRLRKSDTEYKTPSTLNSKESPSPGGESGERQIEHENSPAAGAEDIRADIVWEIKQEFFLMKRRAVITAAAAVLVLAFGLGFAGARIALIGNAADQSVERVHALETEAKAVVERLAGLKSTWARSLPRPIEEFVFSPNGDGPATRGFTCIHLYDYTVFANDDSYLCYRRS